jgi:hypothetical protein
MELLGVIPQGIIFIDSDQLCIKLAKKHCAFVIIVDDIAKVTKQMVLDWRRLFARASSSWRRMALRQPLRAQQTTERGTCPIFTPVG